MFNVIATDGNDNQLASQEIPFSDCKFDMATIWVEYGVALLPSEHSLWLNSFIHTHTRTLRASLEALISYHIAYSNSPTIPNYHAHKPLGYVKMVKRLRIVKQLNYKRCILPTNSRYWDSTKKKWIQWCKFKKTNFRVNEFKPDWYLPRNRTGFHITSGLPF